MTPLAAGIYDRLIDHDTRELLESHPELRAILKKIDAEEVPARFSAFIADVSPVGQSVPPAVELTGFKVYHF
jgi:hypothetical protein